ncbi:GNAT family N-acetyltransferase [Vineibacter terrae]|uniref:GNAT family N-acetyltransferase n=2 Tax=Vineibacter terrae TaxID=2586908 RepID=A0A5C8PV17_9HYPH|nr:GNAT family N-acetyltransferase [Vineibacter terrae]
MSSVVRALRPHDCATAAALHARCFDAPWERPWSADAFGRLLATPGCFGLMLILDGQAMGMALARVAADEAELLTIGVAPDARRRGGASQLLSAIGRRCRRRGAQNIFLEVAEDNPTAQRLYQRHHFVVVGRRNAYFDRGQQARVAALIMRLDLQGKN